jgi:hypothetical protein
MHVFCLQNTLGILLHENSCVFVICDVSTGTFLCRKGTDKTMTREDDHEVKTTATQQNQSCILLSDMGLIYSSCAIG